VGLGLIGGSIGLALRQPGRVILGYDPSPDAQSTAVARQCVDQIVSIEEVSQAEFVFVAPPPNVAVQVIEEVCRLKGPSTVVTDCVSVKADLVAWNAKAKEPFFVPGHPMAGHEKRGAAYASAWLYKNAKWILTPQRHTDKGAVRSLEALLKEMGAKPVRMDAETHDRQVAILSHLPHALAAALVLLGEEIDGPEVAAGSWRDLTRVGGVDPDLWTQILTGNRREVVRAIRDCERSLSSLCAALESEDDSAVFKFLKDAAVAKARQDPPPPPPTRKPMTKSKRRP
jgi:prephenate dehydrogenase